jgi:hypothetical protein
MFWQNAYSVQVTTDVTQKSPMYILTQACRSSERWDARMLAGQRAFNIPTSFAVASIPALRAERVKTACGALDCAVTYARQVLYAEIGLASGGTGSFIGIPTRHTSSGGASGSGGTPLGGRVELSASLNRGDSEDISSGAFKPIGAHSTYVFDSRMPASYDVVWVRADISSMSEAYYGTLTFQVDGYWSLDPVLPVGGFAPLRCPGDDAVTASRSVRLASVRSFRADGSVSEHDYGGQMSNKMSEVFSVNFNGALNPQVEFKIVSYGSGDTGTGTPMTFNLSVRPILQNNILNGDSVPVASATEVKTIEGMRYDDILGQGYTGVGPVGASLGSACGWPATGSAMTKRMFESTILPEYSYIPKYSATNPQINTLSKVTCPPFWSILPWARSTDVRRAFANFVADSSAVSYMVEGSETVGNQFQTRVYGAPVAF